MEKQYSAEFKLSAITWEAKKSNMSYGEYIHYHTQDEIYDVYSEYEKFKAQRKKKESKKEN